MDREIEFHPGLDDVEAYLHRLLHKALARGSRLVVTGPGALLDRLDQRLWTQEPGDFLPHLRRRPHEAAGALHARTPVWLAERPEPNGPDAVLVNLGPELPASTEGFARIVELVGDDADAAAAGRQRWRAYLAAGDRPVDVRQRAQAQRASPRGGASAPRD